MFESARVIVLRGPIAIGKTSVAQELAGILGNVAVVPVDWLRHMVRGWRPESKSEARLAAINAAALACNFTTKGYDVIIEGPFDDPDALEELLSRLEGLNWRLFTLIASWDELMRRHNTRPENHRAELERVTSVYHRILDNRDIGGTWVNTDHLSPIAIARSIARDPTREAGLQ